MRSARRELSAEGPPARAGRAAFLLFLLFLLLPLLAGCAVVDPLTRETCISVIPALEAEGARITVTTVEPDAAAPRNVRVAYRVEDGHGSRLKFVVCAFGVDTAAGDARALVGVRDHHGVMSDGRFYMLRRFWLGDPAAVAEAAARVTIDPAAVPRGLLGLPSGPARVLQTLVDAAAPASLDALLALACALVWGLVGRIFFAVGDLAMLGAYGALIGALVAAGLGAGAAGVLVALGVVVAVAIGASWGAALGRAVFVPLAFRSAQPLLIATVGLSIALQEFVARAQGARERFLMPMLNQPRLIADGPFTVMVTPMRMIVVALAVAATVAVVVVFPRTRLGRAWRAVSDDALVARLFGIDPARVLVATFALAAALAALAGAILSLAWGGTAFHMGTMLGLKAVVAAIVGGIGSLPGAALGGVLVGLAETVWSAAFGIEWRDTAVLSLLIVFLIFRPTGLLGAAETPSPRDRAP